MQQATPTHAADPPSCPTTQTTGSDAAVRVVSPVGGRGGWWAVETDTTPGASTCSDHGGSAGEDVARAWLRNYLGGEVDRDDRILLVLHHYEGLNAREIAAVIDDTEALVDVRLDGLNRTLRAAFSDFLKGQAADR